MLDEKCSSEALQNFPYFWNMKIHVFFFSYFFYPVNNLVNVNIGQSIHWEVRNEICVSNIWLGHFIKHMPPIFKEWVFILSLFLSFKTPIFLYVLPISFYLNFQVRQSWYILSGSVAKVIPNLIKHEIISEKYLDKLINNLLGKLDDCEPSILPHIWDAALLLTIHYKVSNILILMCIRTQKTYFCIYFLTKNSSSFVTKPNQFFQQRERLLETQPIFRTCNNQK